MFSVKIRNTIEHFDEYIDEANVKSTWENDGQDLAVYNMVISRRNVFNLPYFLKVYVVSEFTFYNFKWSINIKTIYEESKIILNNLYDKCDTKDSNGMLISL